MPSQVHQSKSKPRHLGSIRTKGKLPKLYTAWMRMRQRCYDPKFPSYARYGGRGIKVCDHWLVYENFAADIGEPPNQVYSLDRIDTNGDYSLQNCRWATSKQQARNRTNNKVDDATVQQIRNLKGLYSQREIAQMYGISPQFVSKLQRRERWV